MDLLRPFIITASHSGQGDLGDLEPGVREIFSNSDLSQDPGRLNVFMFVLDSEGRVVHEFHGVPGVRRGANAGRSDHRTELLKARAKLNLPEINRPTANLPLVGLPDLPAQAPGLPAGVRLFIRHDEPGNSIYHKLPIVEVVPMMADDWQPLSFTPLAKDVTAEVLKDWLVWLYPAGIRAADEQKPFQSFRGTLKLEPAGEDDECRYAVLHGTILLEKASNTDSTFEGELEAVLSYGRDTANVQSVRGVVEGTYLYRSRATSREKLRVAIESRPE